MAKRRKTAVAGKIRPGADTTKAPAWWLTKPAEIRSFLESLKGVRVVEIGKTAGGRPIIAAEWGAREELGPRTCNNLSSAIAGGDPRAFFGKKQRKRQVILFVGSTHGTELDGTVAALNFLNVLATGKDLRGKRQPELAKEGRRHRFLLVPILNVDGRERALEHVTWLNSGIDYLYLISQGVLKDGTLLRYPTAMLVEPVPREQVEILGTYRNDAGVNLLYDPALGPDCQPENAALLRYCRREMPDLVILSHSDNGSLLYPPSPFIPAAYRNRIAQIGAAVGLRCAREGHCKHPIPPDTSDVTANVFSQTDAVYHVCGALPVLVEFPWGARGLPRMLGEILDIGLTVLEEICAFGGVYGFRPELPVRE